MFTDKISRRDLMKVAGRYGLSSTLLGAATLGGALTLPELATAANSTYKKRFKNSPKFTLKFGAAGLNERNLLLNGPAVCSLSTTWKNAQRVRYGLSSLAVIKFAVN